MFGFEKIKSEASEDDHKLIELLHDVNATLRQTKRNALVLSNELADIKKCGRSYLAVEVDTDLIGCQPPVITCDTGYVLFSETNWQTAYGFRQLENIYCLKDKLNILNGDGGYHKSKQDMVAEMIDATKGMYSAFRKHNKMFNFGTTDKTYDAFSYDESVQYGVSITDHNYYIGKINDNRSYVSLNMSIDAGNVQYVKSEIKECMRDVLRKSDNFLTEMNAEIVKATDKIYGIYAVHNLDRC